MTGFNHEDRDLSTLLQDAVADVEPGDRLTEIRAAVAPRRRRVGWYAAGGATLAAAAAVTAIAIVTSQTAPRADDPGPGPGTSTPSSPSSPSAPLPAEAVYYIGDTPAGPRLFRYFQSPDPGQDVLDLLTETPADPDYRTAWAPGSFASVTFDGPAPGQIDVTIADAALHDRPAGMTEAEAGLAIEQIIYTVQAAARSGERLPVQFRFNGNPIDQVLGVPTSEPVSNGEPLEVLSWVSVSDPAEGRVIDTDTFTARGLVNSFDGQAPWAIQDASGAVVLEGHGVYDQDAGSSAVPFPWVSEVDVSSLDPGRYTFVVHGDDYGRKGASTDTRTIVVE
jgi:hypothetical protein